jgi:3-oxoacyl-[acyl-carrier protein] reductase
MGARAVLVTGGGRGIGRAVVHAWLAADPEARAAFTFRQDEAAARRLVAESGGRAHAFPFDLAARDAPDDLVAAAEEAVGPLAGLVNNAGFRREAIVGLTSDDDWDTVVDANLGGAFRLSRAVLRGMVGRRGGSIVNVSSLAALHAVPGQAAYAAAKAGLLALTRTLAREVGRRGVRVNAVVPGFVATEMTAGLPAEKAAALRASECLPGGVEPGHVAEAILFLLSERSAGITGQALVVDAGASA